MGVMFSAAVSAVAVTAAQDFFEIQPADDKPVKIHAVYLSQHSDFGDAQDELLQVQIIRGFTVSGSVGTTPTARALLTNGGTAAATVEANNTTVANTGTSHTLHADAFNVRAGWVFIPTPEMRVTASQADTTIVVRITAPADSLTMNGTIYFEEGL